MRQSPAASHTRADQNGAFRARSRAHRPASGQRQRGRPRRLRSAAPVTLRYRRRSSLRAYPSIWGRLIVPAGQASGSSGRDARRSRRRLCEPWEMKRVPDVVTSAAAACGAGGWLRDLPGLIAELEAEWSVSVGRPFPHSSEAFVAEASLADGTPAVLKLLIPQDGAAGRHEITMLRLAGGRGCAGLLRDDAARGAAPRTPRALPLRAGPPTRRTAGDTGDGGGHGVAAGAGFRPAYWSGQSAPARRFRHH